ncbi:MAG: peptidylprolyl isomerase [Acidimicrobiia bacterium]|nr:peptidylprolyl isomerase [Acidimicrobiia bacterium]
MPESKREHKKQNKAENRARRAKLQRRNKLKASLRRSGTIFVVVLATLGLFSWLGRDTAGPLGQDYDDARSFATACGTEAAPAATPMQFESPSDQGLTGRVTATIQTSCGPIVIELDPTDAPESVNSFVFLSREGFYDGTVFHRLLTGRELRGGDQRGNGEGGPGYTTPDELPEDGFVYDFGTVAMVRRDRANTTGSQFFIVLADNARLAPRFNVIGRVTSGFETLELIQDVEVGRGLSAEVSRPLETIYIESVEITNAP